MDPVLVMLAGPNGAGKTTFYRTFLEDKGLPFINADHVAESLHIDAYEAARIAEDMRRKLISRSESFISETVLSDPVGAKVDFLQVAVRKGYEVTLFFIGIESAALSKARVQARVMAGGHDVPTEKLMKRYDRTLLNLGRAISVLPRVILYDNSQADDPYRFVAEFRNGNVTRRGGQSPPRWTEPFLRGAI